jgi:hypothetical protein
VALLEYFSLMDSDDSMRALDELDPGLEFVISLPSATVRGFSRDEFASYITGRDAHERRHHVLRHSVDRDIEFVYGIVSEAGAVTGGFMSAARLTTGGVIAQYLSIFDANMLLARLSDGFGDAEQT